MRLIAVCLFTANLLAACGGGSGPVATNGGPAAPAPSATPVVATPSLDPHAQVLAVAATEAPAATGCAPAGPPRRLTRRQLVNVLSDNLVQLTGEAEMAAGIEALVTDTTQFPPDVLRNPDSARHTGYERLDGTLNTRQLGALKKVAETLAARVTADPARVTRLLGACGSDADACMAGFARKAGRIFFRQPVSDADVDVWRRAAGGAMTPAAMTKVLASMMVSPRLSLVVERGQSVAADAGGCVPLNAHELATRLSLHFWDTAPDAALAAAADDASLLTPAVLQTQVRRLVNDARAEAPMRRFFDQWFRLQELVAMDGKVGNARFDAFAAGYRPLATTRDAAINEVLDMVSWLAARDGSLQQVLTDRHAFARTADIATLYGTPVWDGTSTPPLFTETARVGLLTRIGILANGASDTTLPIQRGIRVLSALTCQALPPPAMDQSNSRADLTGVLTTRQRTERVTQMAGTSCVNCHLATINPWGFVFERFDALGRVRTTEIVRDDVGASRGEKPLDTAAVAQLSGVPARAIATAAEAQQLVLDSGHFERCFAKNYVRYTFGRNDSAYDADLIDALRREAAAGTNLKSLLAGVALRREFATIARPR